MPNPVSVRCDECGTTLKLKDDTSLGRKIKCPKCHASFVAKLAESAKPAAAKGKSAAGKKGSKIKSIDEDDDWLNQSFDDIEDTREPEKDEDEEAEEEAKREKAEKKKKKKKGGFPVAIVAGIGAALLMLLGLIGGGWFAYSMYLMTLVSRYSFLPDDTKVIVEVKVNAIWNAELMLPLREFPQAKTAMADMQNQLGVTLNDIDQITLGVRAFDDKPDTAPIGIVRFTKPVSFEKLRKDSDEVIFEGKKYYKQKNAPPETPPMAAYVHTDKLAIFSTEVSLKAALKAGNLGHAGGKFPSSAKTDDFVLMLIDAAGATEKLPSQFKNALTGSDVALPTYAWFGVNMSSDIVMAAESEFATTEEATKLQTKSTEKINELKTKFAEGKAKMQSNPFFTGDKVLPVLDGVEQTLNSIAYELDGKTVKSRMTIQKGTVDAALVLFNDAKNSGLLAGFGYPAATPPAQPTNPADGSANP